MTPAKSIGIKPNHFPAWTKDLYRPCQEYEYYEGFG
ncbi:hypothetical protein E2C01_091101 [Portunus trituberculatus]|uniref:Uncharacterized protein n=1 Tax=Portunus trituberculatus TaxID=210409 RepID=A0A5B7JIA4_PORTR|nr:hypothetical protein [Portunus trituberculatus]